MCSSFLISLFGEKVQRFELTTILSCEAFQDARAVHPGITESFEAILYQYFLSLGMQFLEKEKSCLKRKGSQMSQIKTNKQTSILITFCKMR